MPVYADAVAEEMAYVLDHAGVHFAIAQDQEFLGQIMPFINDYPPFTGYIHSDARGTAVND